MITKRDVRTWFAIPILATVVICATAHGDEQGDDNPTGVAGAFNGNVTTGCSYDPDTGNAHRQIDDIVVPGSVSAYPLKWTRYWNSHVTWGSNNIGASWRFSYLDYKFFGSNKPCTPDGRQITGDYGVEEFFDGQGLHLADGGRVVYNVNYYYSSIYYYPVQIIDPYGKVTTISWFTYGYDNQNHPLLRLDRVTEPGGRYLQINWDSTNSYITSVQAFDGVNPQPIQSVNYTWSPFTLNWNGGTTVQVLTGVGYSDGTSATYAYSDKTYPGAPVCTYPFVTDLWHAAIVTSADDARYAGPMRRIAYVYPANGNKGTNATRILSENRLLPDGTVGEMVSSLAGVPSTGSTGSSTETRGDGPQRTFNYNYVHRCKDCPPPDTQPCLDPQPLDGKMSSFTDFLGHTTTLTYESDSTKQSAGFITEVADPNGHTTQYARQSGSWGITTITHPDGSTIQQTFWPNNSQTSPYYLESRTDELGHTTTYKRDGNNRIIEKDYPDSGIEKFSYNPFGEVTSHLMTSGGTESFVYDGRGLKTSHTDALGNVTTYTYYPDGDSTYAAWTDRLKKVTYPANASNLQASETYEYERNASGTPIASRGLVTKITHADGTFVANTYDTYGDLLSTTDELGNTTSHTYDDYGRVLTTTTPPRFAGDTQNHTTTNGYIPTNQSSSYITTSKLPFSTTLPSGKVTTLEYDANWRKTFTHQAPSTPDAATTQSVYDEGGGNVGHLTSMIDPRGNKTTYAYDVRDRLISTTDPLNHANSVVFDAHGNKMSETHANGELITYDSYDPMNRLLQKSTHRDATTTDVVHMMYDCAGNLQSQIDEDNNTYSYAYDAMNRPLSMIYPDTSKHEDHTYDAAGNPKTYTNRSGAVQTFAYDNRNRATSFTWTNDPANTTGQTTLYDASSRKTQISNNDAVINFVYYNDNKLHSQEEWSIALADNVHRTVTYTYDPDGNRSTIQYPSGTMFDYDYTQRNQVADIKLDGQSSPIVNYTFDPSGNITNRALDNGTATAYTVDAVDKDTSIVSNLASSTTKRFDYAYNSVNDITAVQRDGNSNDGDGYKYDLTQQILEFQQNGTVDLNSGTVTKPATDNNMTFDGCGNRKTLNGVNQAFNNMNEPIGPGQDNDADGNLKTWKGWNYTYDAQNRLRVASNAVQGVTANFYYDGLNRQIARQITGSASSGPTPTPTPLTLPTIPPTPTVPPLNTPTPTVPPLNTPTPTIPPLNTPTPTVPPLNTPTPTVPPLNTPTVPPANTPTPTPTPTPCAPVNFTPSTGKSISMSTTTSGATIFYTTDSSTPTHTASQPTGTTQVYSTPVAVGSCNEIFFEALAYKAGMSDSNVTTYDANYTGGTGCGGGGGMAPTGPSSTTTIFSVWDGDWAILEEYTTSNVLVQQYLEGYHGLVKTFVGTAVYYYQDELGSTSHIANASGALLEYYKYDLYGKPTYFDANGNQLTSSANNVRDLFTGQRWVSEIGLYDDRNRFMSPDLGRFLQPDPIGFKGDSSNLYRYCGNDWANRTDPMGLTESTVPLSNNPKWVVPQHVDADRQARLSADNHTFQEKWSASEVKYQANVDSQHATNMGNARSEVASARAFSAAAADAIAHNPRVAQAGLAGYIDAARAPHTLYLNGQPVWDPFMEKWVQEPAGVSLDGNVQEAKGMSTRQWIGAVDNGGKWDYKQWGPFRDYGNINYGATGRAFGRAEITLVTAGFAKKVANGRYTQKDWARDRFMIELGINYYDQTHQ
ncbi:MAG TPA: RHS repeat-associated core domain-containing protein [Chthoniobacterales bacterium]|jgi:RHS repeat-associated protein|nr:RHS repeat-associated core domain-containing protein [Chthoniobacterales bacterium]